MRWVATGLLLLMAGLLLFAHWAMREIDPAFTWLRAFAEAALVGGLADWFAVTALFRHPLGLPIPHTAIIPRKKDRIGEALAAFLRQNFLTPSIVARRMEHARVSRLVADLLRRPEAGGRLRAGAMALVRQLVRSPAADALADRLRDAADRRLHTTDWPTLAASLMEAATREGRHQALVDRALDGLAGVLDDEEETVRAMVRQRAGWALRLVGLDDRLADEIVAGLRGLFAEMAADPGHPLRTRAFEALERATDDLRHDPPTRARAARAVAQVLATPEVARFLDSLWAEAHARLERLGEGPSTGRFTTALADSLDAGPKLAADFDALARRAAVGLVTEHGDGIVALVSETVGRWDAETVALKLESAVGRDLQYIRLNGTLIGGCVGVALHAIIGLLGF